MTIPNRREVVMLAIVFLIANLANALYAAFQIDPSAGFTLLYYLGLAWAVAGWIAADAKRLGVSLPFDLGWVAFFAWPIALPYHLFSTRGLKGLATLAGFVGLFVGTYLLSLIVFFAVVSVNNSGSA